MISYDKSAKNFQWKKFYYLFNATTASLFFNTQFGAFFHMFNVAIFGVRLQHDDVRVVNVHH